MGDHRDQLRARLVDGLELRGASLCLALHAPLLDDAAQEVGDHPEVGDVRGREVTGLLCLHVEDADDPVVPDEGNGEHRGDEPALVDPADPQEALIAAHVGDHERLARLRDAARHARPERHPRTTDLEPIEPVRGGERQVLGVTIEEVQGGDARPERVARLVDDRLEELFPCARGGGQARHAMQEPELVDLLRRRIAAGCPVAGFRLVALCRPGCLGGLRHRATIAEVPVPAVKPRRTSASISTS
jgi:hypothetical protein